MQEPPKNVHCPLSYFILVPGLSTPMAKCMELQEINFKTTKILSAIKRGATKMFCRKLGGPQLNIA